MAFGAKEVAALREKTGCGMMDCKRALAAADGDEAKAIELLREKGMATAEKKSSRIAAEGVVTTYVDNDKKISVIAEEVGYHDTDYFISRFIEQKGCTPARYRKNSGEVQKIGGSKN